MSTYRYDTNGLKYRLYPAYCWRASRTYDAWVKLTAADIQSLRSEPEFASQRIYFHLNHPIQYVRIVGVVVAIDDINVKYTVLTLDDGSGATIEVKIIRLLPDVYHAGDYPSNTTVENLDVISRMGVFDVVVAGESVDIGTVVKVKGTISEFRGQKQLEMKRVWIIKTTNEEAREWEKTATFKREVLSIPWHINSSEHRKIKDDLKREKKENLKFEKKKAEHAVKMREYERKKWESKRAWEKYIADREVRLEARRRKEEVMMNAGALI